MVGMRAIFSLFATAILLALSRAKRIDWCTMQSSQGAFVLRHNCSLSFATCNVEYGGAIWLQNSSICVRNGTLRIEGVRTEGTTLPIIYRASDRKIHRFFSVYDGGELILKHLALHNGATQIKSSHGSRFDRSQISGGAILMTNAFLQASGVHFRNNFAGDYGGAIYGHGPRGIAVVDQGSRFENNTARRYGGAIGVYSLKMVEIRNSVLNGNKAKGGGGGKGGGIACYGSDCKIHSSIITLNEAESHGGGLRCYICTFLINSSTLSLNSISGIKGAGGLDVAGRGNGIVETSNISRNVGGDSGGIKVSGKSVLSLISSKITENVCVKLQPQFHIHQGYRRAGGILCSADARCLFVAATEVFHNFADDVGNTVKGIMCAAGTFLMTDMNQLPGSLGCFTDGSVLLSPPPYPISCNLGEYKSFVFSPYNPGLTQSIDSKCSKCRNGSFSDELNSTECKQCREGTFEPLIGQVKCSGVCPPGKSGTLTGQSSENEACPILCQPGRYNKVSEISPCTGMCSPGKFGAKAGSASEADACDKNCPAGRYGTVSGQTDIQRACPKVCPKGKYGMREGQGSISTACATCSPSKYCLGGTNCTEGRDGPKCILCQTTPIKYYKSQNKCFKCPENAYGQYLLVLLVFILGCSMLYFSLSKVQRKRREQSENSSVPGQALSSRPQPQQSAASISSFGIAFSQIQTLLVLIPTADIEFGFPYIPESVITFFMACLEMISIDFVSILKSPECDFDLSLSQKYFVVLASPLLFVSFIFLWRGLVHVRYRGFGESDIQDKIVAVVVHLIYINMFTMLLANILVPFACTEGKLNANPGVLCSTYDSTYATMLVACVFAIPLYVVTPMVFLVRNIYGGCRHAGIFSPWEPFATEEQLQCLENESHRTFFTGDADALNTEINRKTRFMNKYGWIFVKYNTNFYFWELVILGRKSMIVLVAIFFASTAEKITALSILVFILLLSLGLTLRLQPFAGEVSKSDKRMSRIFTNANNRLESILLFGQILLILSALLVQNMRNNLHQIEQCTRFKPTCPSCEANVKPFKCFIKAFPVSNGETSPYCAQGAIPQTTAQTYIVIVDELIKLGSAGGFIISGSSEDSQHCVEELKRFLCLIGAPPCSRDCSLKKIPCDFCLSVHRACNVADVFETFLTDEKLEDYWSLLETLLKGKVDSKFDFDTLKAVRNFMHVAYTSCDKETCFWNKTDRLSNASNVHSQYFLGDACSQTCDSFTTVFDRKLQSRSSGNSSTLPRIGLIGDSMALHFPVLNSVAASLQWAGLILVLVGFSYMAVHIILVFWKDFIEERKQQSKNSVQTRSVLLSSQGKKKKRLRADLLEEFRKERAVVHIQRYWRRWHDESEKFASPSLERSSRKEEEQYFYNPFFQTEMPGAPSLLLK